VGRRDSEFREFFEAEFPRLYRLAFLLTHNADEAEDLAQEAMVRTYRAWDRIREGEYPLAYARAVLVNHRRSLARRAKIAAAHPRDPSEPVAEFEGDRLSLWQSLLALPKAQRDAIVLRYYEDLTEAESAAIMRCPVGTVKSHLRRGLSRLRVGLADDAGSSSESREPV